MATSDEMKDMVGTTIDVKGAMVASVVKKEAMVASAVKKEVDTAEAKGGRNLANVAKMEAGTAEGKDVRNTVNDVMKADQGTEVEAAVKTMDQSVAMKVEGMEEAMDEKTIDPVVVTQGVVMNDATTPLVTVTDQAVAMADPQAMAVMQMKSRDVLKLSAMIAALVVVEAMAETRDGTKVVADTTTAQVEDMVEATLTTTVHQEALVAATLATEATQVLMEASLHLALHMAVDMVAQTTSRAPLNMLNPSVATLATPISLAWLLAF
jgi:hypothetical protein